MIIAVANYDKCENTDKDKAVVELLARYLRRFLIAALGHKFNYLQYIL